MPVDNPKYKHAYNAIANYKKADLFKSNRVELAQLNQLNKE